MNPYLASCLSISLDYGSYKWAENQGPVQEINPLVFNQEIVKSLECGIIGFGLSKLDKKNPKLSKKVKIGLFLVNGILAGLNIQKGLKSK